MLSYLAIHPRTTRQRVAAELWPDGAGWDACTGLGRIDGKNLLTELQ
jgi:hypothetical protein